MRNTLLWVGVGFIVGWFFVVPVEGQLAQLAFGQDSVSTNPSVIQTDGSNALKVTGK